MKKIVMLALFVIMAASMVNAQSVDNQQIIVTCDLSATGSEELVMKNISYERGVQNVLVLADINLVVVDYRSNKNTDQQLIKAISNLGFKSVKQLNNSLIINVYGNCSLCKNRIEEASLKVAGVEKAGWSEDKKKLWVQVNENFNEQALHEAVAAVGHDTDKAKAPDEVYNNLHSCCKYDRP